MDRMETRLHGLLIMALFLGACSSWHSAVQAEPQVMTASAGEATNRLRPARTEQECLDRGGEWKLLGLAQLPGCVEQASDAGKPCRDGNECQYRMCLYSGPRLNMGAPATGACKSTNVPFGCFARVQDGKFVGRICAD